MNRFGQQQGEEYEYHLLVMWIATALADIQERVVGRLIENLQASEAVNVALIPFGRMVKEAAEKESYDDH